MDCQLHSCLLGTSQSYEVQWWCAHGHRQMSYIVVACQVWHSLDQLVPFLGELVDGAALVQVLDFHLGENGLMELASLELIAGS